MEQLLPSSLAGAPVVASRGTVTYIRATTAASSIPSSPAITTTASMSVEAQRTSGHVMDRLLGESLHHRYNTIFIFVPPPFQF